MSIKRLVLLFPLTVAVSGQTMPIASSGTFDLRLEQRGGPGASIVAFVARNSHMYFAVSSPNGSLELQTTREGLVERTVSIGAEQVSGFDVDEAGNSYVLHGSSRLTEFNSQGGLSRTLNLRSPIVSFTVSGGRPIGVSPDGRVHFLDGPGGGFALSAYPPPWFLFEIEPDRFGVLRPQGPTLHLLRMEDGDALDASIVWPGDIVAARKPVAAAADNQGRIYVLGERGNAGSTSVIECDDQGDPKFIFNYALATAFNPRMIGIAGEHAYLVDAAGRIAFYPLDREIISPEVLDTSPQLLTDLEPLRAAVRKAGYTGRVVIHLGINREGTPEHVRVATPAFLANVAEVVSAIGAWRFRPGIRAGKQAAMPMELNIDVSGPGL
jgi:hypothetical protein